jgi:hypothetical protein
MNAVEVDAVYKETVDKLQVHGFENPQFKYMEKSKMLSEV